MSLVHLGSLAMVRAIIGRVGPTAECPAPSGMSEGGLERAAQKVC
jgi:hypothetical protein